MDQSFILDHEKFILCHAAKCQKFYQTFCRNSLAFSNAICFLDIGFWKIRPSDLVISSLFGLKQLILMFVGLFVFRNGSIHVVRWIFSSEFWLCKQFSTLVLLMNTNVIFFHLQRPLVVETREGAPCLWWPHPHLKPTHKLHQPHQPSSRPNYS